MAFQTALGVEPSGVVDAATLAAFQQALADLETLLTSTTTSAPAITVAPVRPPRPRRPRRRRHPSSSRHRRPASDVTAASRTSRWRSTSASVVVWAHQRHVVERRPQDVSIQAGTGGGSPRARRPSPSWDSVPFRGAGLTKRYSTRAPRSEPRTNREAVVSMIRSTPAVYRLAPGDHRVEGGVR